MKDTRRKTSPTEADSAPWILEHWNGDWARGADLTGGGIFARLPGGLTRLLVAGFMEAYEDDEGEPEARRGWRQLEELGDACGNVPYTLPLSPDSVRHYICKIGRILREHTPRGMEAPVLFEHDSLLGYRLTHRIKLVDIREQRRGKRHRERLPL